MDVLLAVAATDDCEAAEAALGELTSLTLVQEGLRDLSPLASLTHLTALMLPGNAIAEIRRIAREQAATLVRYSLLGWQVYIHLGGAAGRARDAALGSAG